jgi:hypothetical protein
MLNAAPQFQKHHRIAVIGAGPAGIHMASLLKKRGYDNVTILEKTNRIGGKSYTWHRDGVPYEMGTCFLHNGYHRIKQLARSYGLREDIHPEGRAIFPEGAAPNSGSLELDEFVAGEVYKDWQQRCRRWKKLPATLVQFRLLKAIWDYQKLYRHLLGTLRLPYGIPLHLSGDVLARIDMTFLEFLQQNNLNPLIGVLRIAQAAQGYGYLETTPTYYGLCWATPELLMGLTKQFIGLKKITRMLPDGYETLWRTMAEKDELSIKLNAAIHSIKRQLPEGRITIEYTDTKGERQIEVYDFLILAINLRSALGIIEDPSETEKRLFSALKGFTLTTTLYESDPMPGFSTPDYDKAIAYFPQALIPGHANEWCADRNDRHIFATVNGLVKRFDRQVRVAFQFSDEDPPGRALFGKDDRIAEKLQASWAERGVVNPRIIKQFSWPYFMHFPGEAIRSGCYNQLFACQGRFKTWYAGASASFESVNHVVNYNHALIDTYL